MKLGQDAAAVLVHGLGQVREPGDLLVIVDASESQGRPGGSEDDGAHDDHGRPTLGQTFVHIEDSLVDHAVRVPHHRGLRGFHDPVLECDLSDLDWG